MRLENCTNSSNSKTVDFDVEINLKSKFSSHTCLSQFFVYIPNLGFVSSFENPKLLKWCDSTTVGFEVNFG